MRTFAALAAAVCIVVIGTACGGSGSGTSPSPPATSPTKTGPPPTLDPALHDRIPIDHIVVLMQENHSFDNYLGRLHNYDPTLDVEAEPSAASNPDPANPGGPPIAAFHQTRLCEISDLDHSWNGTHLAWDNGAMDGFTKQNVSRADPSGTRAMGYYNQTDLPFYYGLFDTFAMGDRYFSSILGPTQPNRFYLYSGSSFGHIANGLPPSGSEFAQTSIYNLLDQAGVSWKIYSSEFPYSAFFAYVRKATGHIVPIANYYTDAAAGQLPQVSFVDPVFAGPANVENDEHPPANVQVGEKFVSDVINGLFTSPEWPSSALFLEWDEHGGFYDHVAPPAATPPDNIAPMTGSRDQSGGFDRYGIRVPVAVISPFSKQHFVSHAVHDHASILRFIETRFGLPSLTQRDASADPMLEMFNFQNPAFVQPPTLPEAIVDQSRLCQGGQAD
jgi:phospholipase C